MRTNLIKSLVSLVLVACFMVGLAQKSLAKGKKSPCRCILSVMILKRI